MDGHDVLTYYCLDRCKGFLSEKVEVTPYTYEEEDPGPYSLSERGFEDYLGRQYLSDSDEELRLDFFENSVPIEGKAPAWQIMTIYSYEPDFGMDRDLKLSPLQRFMGSSGMWRHEEYHIILRFGEVTKRFLHFDQMSELAMQKGDRYWALRFAARAIHYLEDCGTPYHTSPGTLFEVLKIPFLYKRQFKKISTFHKFHDRYLGYRLWREYGTYIEEIKTAEPNDPKSLEVVAKTTRREALRLLPETERSIKTLLDEDPPMFSGIECSKDYYDNLVACKDTSELDRISRKVLKNTSSAVKTYLKHLDRRFS
ncbi:MAG TPA: hypothetical protein PKN37_05070 [Mesotoga sp.]|uniref:hypothetical protein n=1 Tax=Mesotoga sp. TaxID=2053577 RepID=UPI001BD5B2E6|nr:hypothetical protein [Mesotoga sp.]HNU23616.1 hypothetical protein [Mesotoga sp.]